MTMIFNNHFATGSSAISFFADHGSFVEHDLVEGILAAGFCMFQDLTDPFARAV